MVDQKDVHEDILLAPIAQASLFMGLTVGLKGFSGAMIGGLNNPRGCVIGGLICKEQSWTRVAPAKRNTR